MLHKHSKFPLGVSVKDHLSVLLLLINYTLPLGHCTLELTSVPHNSEQDEPDRKCIVGVLYHCGESYISQHEITQTVIDLISVVHPYGHTYTNYKHQYHNYFSVV